MAGLPPAEAKFFWTGGPIEIAPRAWFQSAFSGVTGFETDEGLVLVDSGAAAVAPLLAERLRERTDAPIHTAILTHGHLDHAYGLPSFLLAGQASPRVVAHRAIFARFDRYARTPSHNAAINARQFGGEVSADPFAGQDSPFDPPAMLPDTAYDDELTLNVGGLSFEVRHGRGETDDHSWVWCPELGVLCSGDFFVWSVPNAGNPQKAQRYPWDWAVALRQMAALRPRSLAPGHGGPVVNDPDTIERMLIETADYLESVVDQTLDALERGSPPHVDIVHAVRAPRSDSPWLQPIYDEPEFIVRNVLRHFGGWWSGRPSELKPAARADLGRAIAELAGGPLALAERAIEIAARGDLRVACHLADCALEAAPSDDAIASLVAELYEQRAENESGLMARNLFRSAAAYARAGRPFA